jgi:AcrR family transcriptional regulator
MTSKADPSRKEVLLEQIVEYLRDKSISELSFRTLATALDVSTFTLVYHFGTRTELVKHIVSSIVATQKGDVATGTETDTTAEVDTLDRYILRIRESFDWIVFPRHRHLERLELESSIANVLDPVAITFTRGVYADWVESSVVVLRSFGLTHDDSATQARLLANIIYGSQYDIVINDNEPATRAAFERAVDSYRGQIEALMAQSRSSSRQTGASPARD